MVLQWYTFYLVCLSVYILNHFSYFFLRFAYALVVFSTILLYSILAFYTAVDRHCRWWACLSGSLPLLFIYQLCHIFRMLCYLWLINSLHQIVLAVLYASHKCGLMLPKSHVAWSVCLSVCWTQSFAVQKRQNCKSVGLRPTQPPTLSGTGMSTGQKAMMLCN